MPRVEVPNFRPFVGQHCETVATGSLLAAAGLKLSEPMLFGLGEGLGFYFSRPVHFAGHFVAAHGFDDREVLLVDTAPQGSMQRTSRASLEKARFAKGPMAAKARAWTIALRNRTPALDVATRKAIRANAKQYLAPAFKGASHLGILKLAESLPRWLDIARRPADDLGLAALLMERAGTGGSLFRNFYRDFLAEAREYLAGGRATLTRAQALFADSASEWAAIATSIELSGKTGEAAPLRDAAQRCRRVADIEVAAMRLLAAI